MGELCKFLYNHQTTYTVTDYNIVGSTTNITLRTITTPASGTTNYVRKFGKPYAIGDITNAVIANPRSDGGGVNTWKYEFYGWTGSAWTLMGSVTDANAASAFVDGAAFAATHVKIVITCLTGAITITDGDTITLTTDVDAGGLTVNLSGEGNTYTFNAAWGDLTLYLADSGSTYYSTDDADPTDSGQYMHGGKKHTPVAGSEKYHYFDPPTAYGALAARSIVHVLDSEYYQIDGFDMNAASKTLQAALGETPHLITLIGASQYRDLLVPDYNNDGCAFVAKAGSDAIGDGTFQKPYLTISHAITNRGTRTTIRIKDSGTYDEQVTIAAAIVLSPIYGKTPIVQKTGTVAANQGIIQISAAGLCRGITVDGQYTPTPSQGIRNDSSGANEQNTIKNTADFGMYLLTGTGGATRNLIYNCGNAGILQGTSGPSRKNIVYGCGEGIRITLSGVYNGNTEDNILYLNSLDGIKIDRGANAFNGNIINNSIYGNLRYGINFLAGAGGWGGIADGNVIWNNITKDLYWDNSGGGGAPIATNTNYGTNTSWTIGAGCITTDPKLCNTTPPYRLGIASNGGGFHADTNNDNMGITSYGITVTANNNTINGFYIHGNEAYANGIIIRSTNNYTGFMIKWCNFDNFQGMAVDLWDNDTALSASILNCIFNGNGQGASLEYGGNTIQESIFSENYSIGLYLNQNANTINHCVFYGNEQGQYSAAQITSLIFKNSIVNQNSVYGVYAGASVILTYSCITDAMNSFVNFSDSSNKNTNPLFWDVTNLPDGFKIKSKAAGYYFDSPCVGAADDNYDMGAWLILASFQNDYWQKYTVSHNPRNMNDSYDPKGLINLEDGFGKIDHWAKSFRIQFPLKWATNSPTNEEQRFMIRHLSERIKSRQSEYTSEECKIRFSPLPISFYGSGTGTVDASALTLTDTTAIYYPNQKKGYYVTIVWESETGNVDASTKIVTCAGASWTVDARIGYYWHYNGYYYYILDNDGTTLTISDPLNTLSNATGITVKVVKYFKIEKNNTTILTLLDPNSALENGSYSYYIDFAECKVAKPGHSFNQAVYDFETEITKSGYNLILEEI